jgi:hypothetical protein
MSQRAHGPFESRWRNKQLLKQAFEDCLPLSVRAKPKRPFDASLAILFAGHEGVAALQNLKHADALAPYFDLDQVRTWISQNDASRNLQHVWLLYNLHLWLSFNNNTSSS